MVAADQHETALPQKAVEASGAVVHPDPSLDAETAGPGIAGEPGPVAEPPLAYGAGRQGVLPCGTKLFVAAE
ncbi:hypothetical protein WN71_020580 [Streptomyces mangrovisoli]|uniref:Uncharacterized protein n=1 Tax=Streptomyces mangrovisoli TaxID=1428628 RepID=A0A1J4NXV5_9ACTN|nr:hypothetical protein WN71_020580 [Streptomyces mangrovisoli]